MKKIAVLMIMLAAAVAAFAQSPVAKLKASDIEKFIKDFPSLSAELEALGAELDAEAGSFTYSNGADASAKVEKIFRKHNWSEDRIELVSLIIQCYLAVKLEEGMNAASPEMAAAIAEIENNPYLPDEQKQAMIQMMGGMQEALSAAYVDELAKKDLDLIRKYLPRLDTVFESM